MAVCRDRRDFTRAEVLSLLSYDPSTGMFAWVNSSIPTKHNGKPAGTIKDGYIQIKVFGRVYRAHHLAWLIMTGEWPTTDRDVEHHDGDRSNNAWLNLRPATRSQNNMNAGVRADNRSGFKGVGFHVASGLWYARVTVSRRVISLGYHKSFEAAVAARIEGEKRHFGKFSSLNRTV